jgi:hypothetical protein
LHFAGEEDAGAAAPGVQRHGMLVRLGAPQSEVLWCSLPKRWWWRVAAVYRDCTASRLGWIGCDDVGFGELQVKALH